MNQETLNQDISLEETKKEKEKKPRVPKSEKSIFICKYDLERAIKHDDGSIEIPPHVNDLTEQQSNDVLYLVAKGANKVMISKTVEMPVDKLELFFQEVFNTKKITEIRKSILLESSDYPEIKSRVEKEASTKKKRK